MVEGTACTRCGTTLDPLDRFCGECGGPIEDERPPKPPAPPPEEARYAPPPARESPFAPPPASAEYQPDSSSFEALDGSANGPPGPLLPGRPDAAPAPTPVAPPDLPAPGADPHAGLPEAPPSQPTTVAASSKDGFRAGNRGYGLTVLRIAMGFLFVFPRNLFWFSDPWFDASAETYPWQLSSFVEYWAQAASLAGGQDFFYAVSITQIVAGAFIMLGLLFRLACVLMASTFVGVWAFVYLAGSSIEVQLAYLSFALAFLGLMIAGPGRLALRRKLH